MLLLFMSLSLSLSLQLLSRMISPTTQLCQAPSPTLRPPGKDPRARRKWKAVLGGEGRARPMPLNTSSGLSALETFDAVDYHLLRREWGPLSLFNGFPSAVHFALLALDFLLLVVLVVLVVLGDAQSSTPSSDARPKPAAWRVRLGGGVTSSACAPPSSSFARAPTREAAGARSFSSRPAANSTRRRRRVQGASAACHRAPVRWHRVARPRAPRAAAATLRRPAWRASAACTAPRARWPK